MHNLRQDGTARPVAERDKPMNKYTAVLIVIVAVLAFGVVGVTSYSAGHHQRELDQIHGQLSTEIEARKELERRVEKLETRWHGTGAEK